MADYTFWTLFFIFFKSYAVLVVIGTLLLLAWWVRVARRKRSVRRVLLFFACLMLFGFVVIAIRTRLNQASTQIIQRSSAIPFSKDVCVLQSYQHTRIESSEIWLHFTISPKSLETILSSGVYRKLDCRNLNYEAYNPPQWWDINRLGNCSFYQCASGPVMGYDNSAKDIVVNAERSEVLFLMRCWYN